MKRIFSCETCKKEVITWDKTRKTCSWECRNKRISKLYKGKIFTEKHKESIRKNHHNVCGDKNPNWKGGINPWHKNARSTRKFKDWRIKVLARDGNACVICGKTRSLEVDHIKPLFLFPELMHEVSNGQTLCCSCHRKKNVLDRKVYKFDFANVK